MAIPLSLALKPSAFLTCLSLTRHPRHAAERVLGHCCGQSGQRPGADQGKHCCLGSWWFLVPLGALWPLGLSPEACVVWPLLGGSGQLDSHTPMQEACFTCTEFGEPETRLGLPWIQYITAQSLQTLKGAL